MVKKWVLPSIIVMTFAAAVFVERPQVLCEGFLPENNLIIPTGISAKGITEAQFNEVLDKVEEIYAPIVAQKGGRLSVKRLWSNNTVNASAMQWGSSWIINMYGGLARHEAITQDGFALVACHEMGHHLGGVPRSRAWASNEGQCDYFSTLKCLRKVFKGAGGFSRPAAAGGFAKKMCAEKYETGAGRVLCERNAAAGMSTAALFQIGRGEENQPALDTPDPNIVASTNNRHPATQCRLDTYFSGSLCPKAVSDEVGNDPSAGTCTRAEGYTWEARPRCWYKPPASAQGIDLVFKEIDESPVSASKFPSVFKKEGSAFSALRRMAGSSR